MNANMGSIDRFVRALIGIFLIALASTGAIGAWGWVGIVQIATAAFGFCPLYTLLGFSTCPKT